MKKIILIFIVAFVSALTGVTCAAENIPVMPDSSVVQEKADLTLLQMKQKHELELENLNSKKMQTALIPVVAIVFVFGVPAIVLLLIVLLTLRYRLKIQKDRCSVIEKAIESGRELPDSFFEEPSSKKPLYIKKRLSTAFTLIALGVGILFFGLIAENKYIWAFSAIPILIGLGQLFVYKIEEKSHIEEQFSKGQYIDE